MRLSPLRILGWVAVAGLLAWSAARPALDPGRRSGWAMWGPVSHFGSDVAWLASERARREGDHGRAVGLATWALELDPESTDGWDRLAHYQALVLGSPLREPDAVRREAWLRAGVATARLGESTADRPSELAFLRGMLLQMHAELDPETAWPGGVRALWTEAARAYAQAEQAGHADAPWMRAHAEESAAATSR